MLRTGWLPSAHCQQRRGAGPRAAPHVPGLAGGAAAVPLAQVPAPARQRGLLPRPTSGRSAHGDRCGRPPALSCCARRCSLPGRAAGRHAAQGSPPAAPWPPRSARRPPAERSCVTRCMPGSARRVERQPRWGAQTSGGERAVRRQAAHSAMALHASCGKWGWRRRLRFCLSCDGATPAGPRSVRARCRPARPAGGPRLARALQAEQGGVGGLVGEQVLAGGLAQHLRALRDVQDVVHHLRARALSGASHQP